MAAADHEPLAVDFTLVRRGFDPGEVTTHLDRIDAEIKILVGDRAAALEQASHLGRELDGARRELAAAQSEVERLRAELRVLCGPVINVENMDERLQVMLRLAHDEFGGMRAAVAGDVAEIIAAAGLEAGASTNGSTPSPAANGAGWRSAEAEREIDRFRREEAAERTRLDEAAANRRAQEDEEFRITLAIRCREALAQLTKLQAESLRTARQVLADADAQVRVQLERARVTARDMVESAKREVDDLHALREQLTQQLDVTRDLLDRARPATFGSTEAGNGSTVPGPSAVPPPEHLTSAAPPASG